MKRVFIFPESKRVQEILNESYPSILAALKVHKPNAKSLIEDNDFDMLHDLMMLIKTKQVAVQWMDSQNDDKCYLALTVKED